MSEKERRSLSNLQKKLKQQLNFLEKSVNDFDKGDEAEAIRMAGALRMILHDTNNYTSLLTQLNMEELLFYDTCLEDVSDRNTSHFGLVQILLKTSKYVALLDDTPHKKVDFDTWWNEIVFRDSTGHSLSRRDVVVTMADQDGGAHVDRSVNKEYSKLSKGEYLGHKYSQNGKHWFNMQGAELTTVRQIAHEVLKTLKPNYKKQPNLPNGSLTLRAMKMVLGKRKIRKTEKTPKVAHKKVGRNEPCPCGSGKKYKKCCGK